MQEQALEIYPSLCDPVNLGRFFLRTKEWRVKSQVRAIIRMLVAVLLRRQSVKLRFLTHAVFRHEALPSITMVRSW